MFENELNKPRFPRPLIASLAFFFVLVVAAVVPLPHTAKGRFKLAATSTSEVKAPRGGVIGQLVAQDGQWVNKGAVIAKFDSAESQRRLTELEAKLETAQNGLEKASAPPKRGARGVLAKVKHPTGPLPAEFEKEISEVAQEMARLKTELDEPNLVAPASGHLTGLAMQAGKSVMAGETVAKLDDISTLKVIIPIPAGEKLAVGQEAELELESGIKVVTLEKVTAEAAEATLDNSAKLLETSTEGSAKIKVAPKSILGL